MGSCGKGKEEASSGKELTDTLSETVNSHDSVNKVLTLTKFSSPLQRISEKHRMKAEIVAKEHGRKTFNEVLDVYEFCYDFVRELSLRLGVLFYKVPDEVEKYLPQSEADIIGVKLNEFFDGIGLNGETRKELEPLIYKLIFDVKVKKKKLEDVQRVLAVLGEQ